MAEIARAHHAHIVAYYEHLAMYNNTVARQVWSEAMWCYWNTAMGLDSVEWADEYLQLRYPAYFPKGK